MSGSERPEFWDTRYAAGRTPWDFGGVPAALTRWLAAHPGRGERVLIPGCGSGYELEAFAAAGYDTTALDFSAPAVARAKARVSPRLADRLVQADFFSGTPAGAPFALVYERTFLCALPPRRWPELVARTRDLLAADGRVVGLYFFGEKDDGPPYGLDRAEPAQLFDAHFALEVDDPVPAAESLPLFAGRERWQERRRR